MDVTKNGLSYNYIVKYCLSHIGCMCLVSAIYNLSLQLQRLGHFVVVLWLCNVLQTRFKTLLLLFLCVF